YADYIFAMKNGKLLAEGTPNEIITTDSVKQIYGIDSVVIEDPMSLSPFVIPISAHDNLQRS
ncbi:iron complex transport system ATP-binding protein, partial [Pseudobutyrivibrio sp. C4]